MDLQKTPWIVSQSMARLYDFFCLKVSFNLNEELSVVEHSGEKAMSVRAPREHPFTMQTVGGQTLAIFTENSSGEPSRQTLLKGEISKTFKSS